MILLLSLIGISCGAASDDASRMTWLVEIVNKLSYPVSAIIDSRGGGEYLIEIPVGRMISERISVYESPSEKASDGIRELSIFTEDDDSEEDILVMVLKGKDLDDRAVRRETTIFDILEGIDHLVKFRLEVIEDYEGIGFPEE